MLKRLDDKQLGTLAVDIRAMLDRIAQLDAERAKLSPLLAEKQIALDAALATRHSA